jgi:uncharacterized protein YqhQ
MIPVLSGISYEYIRLISKHLDSPFIRFISKPNLALQQMTTREPTADMLEVSIWAFKLMKSMEDEKEIGEESH